MSSAGLPQRQPRVSRWSIRTRLLTLLLSLTTILVVTAGYLGVNSVQRVGRSAQQISSEALRTQAEDYLRQVSIGDARRNDLIFEQIQLDVQKMARYAASILDNPETFLAGGYWRAEEHMFFGDDGQYINGESDTASVFLPNFQEVDDDVLRMLELTAYLDFVFIPTYESNPNTVAVYVGTENETTRYYPNINLGAVLPADFQVTGRPWYVGAGPENNPNREVIWSPVYVDATGQGLMVTAAAPIYTSQDEFVGVIGIDVTLGDITASVEENRLLGLGYSFLIDNTGHAIALPQRGYLDILGRPPEEGELWVDLSDTQTEFAPVLAEMMAGSTGFQTLDVGGKELFVAYAPLESTGWSLANVVEADAVLQALAVLEQELDTSTRALVLARILPFAAAILIGVVIIGMVLTNRMTVPIRRLAEAAQRLGSGQWDTPLPPAGDDEIGVLSHAFGTMRVQLRDLIGSLEQRVAERTAALARRSAQLEAAVQVAREAAAIRDVDQLLETTVRLIPERFGFYHAGIFILDKTGEWAVLRAASSEGGQRMLERGHRLRVGEEGIVGHVAATGRPRIVQAVGEEAVFFDNPDLPETKAEVALPLTVRGRIIGVLDIQSTQEGAFTEEDVAVMRVMADQLALAIENARLLTESQKALDRLSRYRVEETIKAWRKTLLRRGVSLAYLYDQTAVRPLPTGETPAPLEGEDLPQKVTVRSHPDGRSVLVAPIRVYGQTIGVLSFEAHRTWERGEVALVEAAVEQMGLALENARLLEETRRRAERERLIAEITARVRASMAPEAILRTAAHELGRALDADRTVVQIRGGAITAESEPSQH